MRELAYRPARRPTKLLAHNENRVASGLVLDLDADDPNVLHAQVAGAISKWLSSPRLANNVTQDTGSAQPLTNSTTLNNKNVISFVSSDSLTGSTTATLGMNSSDYEVFIVFRSSSAATQFLFAGAFADKEIHLNGVSGARFIPQLGSGDYSDVGADEDYTDGAGHIVNARNDNGTATVRVDAVDAVDTSADGDSGTDGQMFLGIRANSSLPLIGDIARVLIFNRLLSSAERSAVEAPLTNGWGL